MEQASNNARPVLNLVYLVNHAYRACSTLELSLDQVTLLVEVEPGQARKGTLVVCVRPNACLAYAISTLEKTRGGHRFGYH